MSKIISREQAAALVKDGATLVTTGFDGFGCPEDLIMALAERFHKEGHPLGLTAVKGTSQGDGHGRGYDHLEACEGMFRRFLVTHMGYDVGVQKAVMDNKYICHFIPLGNYQGLLRAIAGGLPGSIARTGVGTFADPRFGGGKTNRKTEESGIEIVQLVELGGQECLFYPAFPLDICFIRASFGDSRGNLSMKNEAMILDQFDIAAAVHNSGGIVIAQVDKVLPDGDIPTKEVYIHGSFVDYVVEGLPEYSWQSFEMPGFRPEIAGLSKAAVVKNDPLPMSVRKICCRRAFLELKPGMLINLGVGMPSLVGSVVEEEGATEDLTMTIECGVIGGSPLGKMDFGASVNPEAIYSQSDMLMLYDGGALDAAVIGFAEVDRLGNVNAHSFNGHMVGPGGFPDITSNAKKICFIGNLTTGGLETEIRDGGIHIVTEGRFRKFVDRLETITFSGTEAVKRGQDVLFITERAVFRLTEGGLLLTEAAEGIDIQKDIIDRMGFTPMVAEKITKMDPRIFREDPMKNQ